MRENNDLVNRTLFRSTTFWLCVCVGIGGIAPDIGHFLNIITKGQVDWLFAHRILFWFWWTVAFGIGLFSAVVLKIKRKHSN